MSQGYKLPTDLWGMLPLADIPTELLIAELTDRQCLVRMSARVGVVETGRSEGPDPLWIVERGLQQKLAGFLARTAMERLLAVSEEEQKKWDKQRVRYYEAKVWALKGAS